MSRIFEAVQRAKQQPEDEEIALTVLSGVDNPEDLGTADWQSELPFPPYIAGSHIGDAATERSTASLVDLLPSHPGPAENIDDIEQAEQIVSRLGDPIQDYINMRSVGGGTTELSRTMAETTIDSGHPTVVPFRHSGPSTRLNPDRIRTVPLTVGARSPLLPFDTDNWHASEQYRSIRTRILNHAGSPRRILITSAGPGDGKSVTAINIAGALSLKAEMDVLLMDCDFRRSSIHRQLRLNQTPGVTDLLLGHASLEDALIRAEQFPNLYVLTAGSQVDNPSDLLETPAWSELTQQIIESFRYVILDSPPIAAVSEYDLLEAVADGVIVIVRQDHTKLDLFLQGVSSVSRKKLLGVALNCADQSFFSAPAAYYDYRHSGATNMSS